MKRNDHMVREGAAPSGRKTKKTLRDAVAAAAMTLYILASASCVEQEEQLEMTFQAMTEIGDPATKGYVPGGALVDASYEAIHGSAAATRRSLMLTSWMYPSSGDEQIYFEGLEFAQRPGTGLWHATPSVYWPAGVRMDFIAWSSGERLAAAAHSYDRTRATDVLYLKIGKPCTQDDILFSWAGTRVSGVTGVVDMTFQHSQAWIEIVLKMSVDVEPSNVLLHKIVLEDIYTSGELTVRHPFGFAEGSWSFRFDRAEDTVMDDPGSVYGTRLQTTPKYVDMLLPEQGRKDIVLYYSMGDQDNVLQFVYHLDQTATWEMGKRYIYEVTFTPSQITVNPVIEDWLVQNVAVPVG